MFIGVNCPNAETVEVATGSHLSANCDLTGVGRSCEHQLLPMLMFIPDPRGESGGGHPLVDPSKRGRF